MFKNKLNQSSKRLFFLLSIIIISIFIFFKTNVLHGFGNLKPQESQIVVIQPKDDLKQMILAKTYLAFLYNFDSRERSIYSQNGEDGVLEYIFDNIGTKDKYYVEFGTENGAQCNTRLMWERYGWDGLLLDGDGKADDARIIRNHFINAENIVSLFEKYQVRKNIDLLSVDIDFADFYVAEAILSSGYRPRVLITEINRNWGPDESFTVTYENEHTIIGKCNDYWGMSQLASSRLGRRFGYIPLYVDKNAVNLFFLHEDTLLSYLADKDIHITAQQLYQLVPPFSYVYRRQETTLCGGSYETFRENVKRENWVSINSDGILGH